MEFGVLVNVAILSYLFIRERRGWLPQPSSGAK